MELAPHLCAALGNEPQEKFSGQNSDLTKGLHDTCTFICWDGIEALWRHNLPLPNCRRSGIVMGLGALGTLDKRLSV